MKPGHINYHPDQHRRLPATSILIGLVCLSGILWLSIAPIFLATRCGLLLPHDHLLLGGANESDLEAHLSAEVACAIGGAPDRSPVNHIHFGGGTIISMSHFEPESTSPGGVLNFDQLALVIPDLLAGSGLLSLFVWWLPTTRVAEYSYFLPPRDPPPKARLFAD